MRSTGPAISFPCSTNTAVRDPLGRGAGSYTSAGASASSPICKLPRNSPVLSSARRPWPGGGQGEGWLTRTIRISPPGVSSRSAATDPRGPPASSVNVSIVGFPRARSIAERVALLIEVSRASRESERWRATRSLRTFAASRNRVSSSGDSCIIIKNGSFGILNEMTDVQNTPGAIFYFDLGSPFAYLAAERLEQILPASAIWQPVSLGALFKATGRSSWALGGPLARESGMAEVERRARSYGLPPIRWPDPWPS